MKNKKRDFKGLLKRIIPTLLLLIIVVVISRAKAKSTVEVRRVDLSNRIVQRSVSASGVVKSKNEVGLSFPLVGVIKKVNVEEGDFVKKGQLLAYLDTSSQRQNVQYYKDARDIKLRQKDLFEEEQDANETLLGGEDAYNIKLREYNESISQAEASYQAALATLSNHYIYAPFDGTIIKVSSEDGETAIAGSTIVELADLDNMAFEIEVDQEDYGLLSIGQEVELKLDAYPSYTFYGIVNKLPLYADTNTDSFVVDIDFSSRDDKLKLGLLGDAYMIIEKTDSEVNALAYNEIFYDSDDNPFVWIIDGKKIKKIPIEVGIEGDIFTEVISDLSGKTIVIPASDNLEINDGFYANLLN